MGIAESRERSGTAATRFVIAAIVVAALGLPSTEGHAPCDDAAWPPQQDMSVCFAGDVPTCGRCRDAWRFASEMLVTSFTLTDSGRKNYIYAGSSVLVASGRIDQVSGLPNSLLTRGVQVPIEFEIDRAYLRPTIDFPDRIQITMDSDPFAWRDFGISRFAFRHSVLPFAFHHFNAINASVRDLEGLTRRPVDWQGEPSPPQVYSSRDYGGDVPLNESVLATSLPRLRAVGAWLESALLHGLGENLSADGSTLHQPADVQGYAYPGVRTRRPQGGGFHDRSGALRLGDTLLIVFRRGDMDGSGYRVGMEPTWQIFWGAERLAVEEALEELTGCAMERTGSPFLVASEGPERTVLQEALEDCNSELRPALPP